MDSNGNIIGPVVSNIEATMNFVGDKMEEADIPIPNGFYHVQGTTIDDGFVISDVEGDDLNNTAGGNQFVWVPVDKNQKLEINVTSKENIKSIELMNPNGEISTLAENYEGESYSSTVENLEINGPYILKVSTETENKEIMVGVHGLYAGDTLTDWYLTDENIEKTYGEEGITDIESLIGLFQEMGYEINTIWDLYKFYGENMNQMRYIIDTDYTDSVKSNGGFYIGRFEASEENEKVVCKKNRTSWTLSYSESLSNTNKMYTSNEYTSTLLTGAAWDRTLLWLYETGEKTLSEIVNDSTSWGIYSTDRINTGSDEKTSANNIYDLAGNWREWTTEGSVGNSDDKYARGGAYTISNSDSSAMNRKLLNAIITSSQIAGFRPALFLAVPNE